MRILSTTYVLPVHFDFPNMACEPVKKGVFDNEKLVHRTSFELLSTLKPSTTESKVVDNCFHSYWSALYNDSRECVWRSVSGFNKPEM